MNSQQHFGRDGGPLQRRYQGLGPQSGSMSASRTRQTPDVLDSLFLEWEGDGKFKIGTSGSYLDGVPASSSSSNQNSVFEVDLKRPGQNDYSQPPGQQRVTKGPPSSRPPPESQSEGSSVLNVRNSPPHVEPPHPSSAPKPSPHAGVYGDGELAALAVGQGRPESMFLAAKHRQALRQLDGAHFVPEIRGGMFESGHQTESESAASLGRARRGGVTSGGPMHYRNGQATYFELESYPMMEVTGARHDGEVGGPIPEAGSQTSLIFQQRLLPHQERTAFQQLPPPLFPAHPIAQVAKDRAVEGCQFDLAVDRTPVRSAMEVQQLSSTQKQKKSLGTGYPSRSEPTNKYQWPALIPPEDRAAAEPNSTGVTLQPHPATSMLKFNEVI